MKKKIKKVKGVWDSKKKKYIISPPIKLMKGESVIVELLPVKKINK